MALANVLPDAAIARSGPEDRAAGCGGAETVFWCTDPDLALVGQWSISASKGGQVGSERHFLHDVPDIVLQFLGASSDQG